MLPMLVLSLTLATQTAPQQYNPAEGWINLFDGESTRGWTGGTVKDGQLIVPPKTQIEYLVPVPVDKLGLKMLPGSPSVMPKMVAAGKSFGVNRVALSNSSDKPAAVAGVYLLPKTEPLFNGRDLTGWHLYTGDPKREKSQFAVNAGHELTVKNGPGDLQTDAAYDDFLLQVRCKTNGDNLNSGIFFRCLPKEYQQGYEAQIHNGIKENDPTKPLDFGTGAIYRREPVRKVVSHDREFFTLTVLAVGNRFQTWVDGVPVLDWTDTRPAADNARKGAYLKPGHLSIQGHDPTTDLVFQSIRIARLK